MEKKVYLKNLLAFLGVATLFSIGPPASAQTQNNNPPPRANDTRSNDTTQGELASFDRFLDSHREIAEQVRRDPSLLNKQGFVTNHPALQNYLQQHPQVREEITENPSAFMHQENRYDRAEDARDRGMNRNDLDRGDLDARRNNDDRGVPAGSSRAAENQQRQQSTQSEQSARDNDRQADRQGDQGERDRGELARFDRFLDEHRELADQIRRNPSLVNNEKYVHDNPPLQSFLEDNPGIRQQLAQDPSGFMQREDRYDAREGQLARFDRFLDGHRELAEQIRKNPSLVNNEKYVQDNPPLESFLRDNPGIRQQLAQNPSSFMQQEDRYDVREDARYRNQGELARFDQFLDGHRELAEQIRKNPSLVDNQKYVHDNPPLESFLQQNPGIRQQLAQNPSAFMQREDRYDTREDARNGRMGVDEARDRDRGMNQESFDRFLDTHREEAEQVRHDPTLLNNRQFVTTHPALQAYLQDHPDVRQQLAQNPNGVMDRYDRRENQDMSHMQQAQNFRDFLGGHSSIAQDLSRDPMKAKDPDYQRNHPELQAYLSAHPDVQSALSQNPQSFMKSVQKPAAPATNSTGSPVTGTTGSTTKTPPPAPKPPMG